MIKMIYIEILKYFQMIMAASHSNINTTTNNNNNKDDDVCDNWEQIDAGVRK